MPDKQRYKGTQLWPPEAERQWHDITLACRTGAFGLIRGTHRKPSCEPPQQWAMTS
jgi:hypothetical protein